MAVKSMNDLFLRTLKDIYYAEKQIYKNLPKMAKSAGSKDLKQAFEKHREETKQQIERLETIFEQCGVAARAIRCEAMDGILAEAKEVMEEIEDGQVHGLKPISPAPKSRPKASRFTRLHSPAIASRSKIFRKSCHPIARPKTRRRSSRCASWLPPLSFSRPLQVLRYRWRCAGGLPPSSAMRSFRQPECGGERWSA
jgi:hypothetical protein